MCRESVVVNVTVDARRRATIKVLSTVLQCIDAACESLGEKAGGVIVLLEVKKQRDTDNNLQSDPNPMTHLFLTHTHLLLEIGLSRGEHRRFRRLEER